MGQRMLLADEREQRSFRVGTLESLVDDKRAELQALLVEYMSLASMEQRQRDTIEKLFDGLPNGT